MKTLSNDVEYLDKLKGLYSNSESSLLDTSDYVKSVLATQCLIEEGSIMGTGNQKSSELVSNPSEDVNIVHCGTSQHSVPADAVDALLGKIEVNELDTLQVMEGVDTKVNY